MNKKDTIAVLGYGSQGRAIALNLRDSGYQVTVGLREKSPSRARAWREKIHATTIRNAVRNNPVVFVALPDHVHGAVFHKSVSGYLNRDASLIFLHGSTVHFGLVEPPPDNPVLLLAPHAPGSAVRSNYLNKIPFSAFCAVYQGQVRWGHNLLREMAGAIGIPGTHLIKTTFMDEAVGDLFGEQTVLCGGLARLLKYGYETLVEAGLTPQNAYLEVAFQLDLIVDLIKRYGLSGMFERISRLARYGSAVNGPEVITPEVKRKMKKVFALIDSGEFTRLGQRERLKPGKRRMEKVISSGFDRQARRFAPKD